MLVALLVLADEDAAGVFLEDRAVVGDHHDSRPLLLVYGSQQIEDAVLDIVNKYLKKGPDATTLGKVQEQMIINRGTARQNNGFWMGQIIGSYQYNEDRDANASLDEYGKQVKSVTADEIKAMAQKFLNLNNYAVITLVPETK